MTVIYRVVSDIIRNEGIRGFYHGYVPSILMSTYGVIQMFTYENINFLLGYNSQSK